MNIDVGDGLRGARSESVRKGTQAETVPKLSRPMLPPRGQLAARSFERGRVFDQLVRSFQRVALPAMGLLALLGLGYLNRAEPTTLLDGILTGSSAWLSLGALCVPLTFLAVHLTSRRYGPAIAMAQVFVAWMVVSLVAIAYPLQPAFELGAQPVSPARLGLALAGALFLSQIVAIVAFDAGRSRRWWAGPFYGFVWACLAFALTFYPAAYLGTGGGWTSHLSDYLIASLVVSVVLMVPYWIARPLVPPLPGLAGY